MAGAITDVAGIQVGHYTDRRAATGCTVVLCSQGAVAGVDVRGSAPGTRETDLLRPGNLVERVHAVLLAGGSAFGLDAAGGVMRYLEEHGYGFEVGTVRVPIVPAAIIFDLALGEASVRPGPDEGHQACLAAKGGDCVEGSVGVGTGASVGKALGMEQAMKGGVGTASRRLGDGLVVGALVAANAFGDIVDPATGQTLAAPRRPEGGFCSTLQLLVERRACPAVATNTTLAVVATNARLDKAQATKVAQMAHDGVARAVRPSHTMADGDVVFALSLPEPAERDADVTTLGTLAAEVVAEALVRGVTEADSLAGVPGVREWRAVGGGSKA